MADVASVDHEPFQNGFTISIQSNLRRESSATYCALVSQSLAFLNKIRFYAKFNSIPTRDLAPKKFPGRRLLKTKLARTPILAIFFGHYRYVYGFALVIGGLKTWNALRRDAAEFIPEDYIVASEQITRIYGHDAQLASTWKQVNWWKTLSGRSDRGPSPLFGGAKRGVGLPCWFRPSDEEDRRE